MYWIWCKKCSHFAYFQIFCCSWSGIIQIGGRKKSVINSFWIKQRKNGVDLKRNTLIMIERKFLRVFPTRFWISLWNTKDSFWTKKTPSFQPPFKYSNGKPQWKSLSWKNSSIFDNYFVKSSRNWCGLITFNMHNCLLNGAWFSETFTPLGENVKKTLGFFCLCHRFIWFDTASGFSCESKKRTATKLNENTNLFAYYFARPFFVLGTHFSTQVTLCGMLLLTVR